MMKRWSYQNTLAVLLFAAAAVPCMAQAPAQKRAAYIIANESYAKLAPVRTAVADGQRVATALQGLGFKVTLAPNQTLGQIRIVETRMRQEVAAGDLVLFYFTGHAITHQEDTGKDSWILGVDFDPASTNLFAERAYSLQRPKQILADADSPIASALFMVLDSAFEEPALARIAQEEGLGLLPVDRLSSVTYAVPPGRSQPLPGKAGTGIFAESFARALEVKCMRLSAILGQELPRQWRALNNNAQSRILTVGGIIDDGLLRPCDPVVVTTAAPPPPKTGDVWENPKENDMKYVYVAPGAFRLGCVDGDRDCNNDEGPAKAVRLTRPFWIARQEVNVGAYRTYTQATKKSMPDKSTRTNPGWRDTAHPISEVSWLEAKDYCAWAGGRLPTEAEWELAARGGTPGTIFPWGNTIDHNRSNYSGEDKNTLDQFGPGPATGRTFPPTGWGLYDMIGNVAEWVADYYGTRYDPSTTDPHGPTTGTQRVVKGGSFAALPKESRISARTKLAETERANFVGFRCVLER